MAAKKKQTKGNSKAAKKGAKMSAEKVGIDDQAILQQEDTIEENNTAKEVQLTEQDSNQETAGDDQQTGAPIGAYTAQNQFPQEEYNGMADLSTRQEFHQDQTLEEDTEEQNGDEYSQDNRDGSNRIEHHEQINYEDVINLDQQKMEDIENAVTQEKNYYDSLEEPQQELLGKRRLNNGESIVNRQLDQLAQPHKKLFGEEAEHDEYQDYQEEEEDYFEINENIEEMMQHLNKNPIALLNEFCSKIKKTTECRFKIKNSAKKQIYFCQMLMNNKPLHQDFMMGDSKQSAKTESSKAALDELIKNPVYQAQLFQLLSRQRRSQILNQRSANPSQDFTTIEELIKDEANILTVMNSFAQNCKEALKWRIESDGSMCVAEIRIGQLASSAVKANKRNAKLAAAKNLLKAINSNTYLREKFYYYSKNMKDVMHQKSEELKNSIQGIQSKSAQEQRQLPQSIVEVDPEEATDIEIDQWFKTLDTVICQRPSTFESCKLVFSDIEHVIQSMYPGQNLKLIPIGSFLIGCMRYTNKRVDAILFDEIEQFHQSLTQIRDFFYLRRDNFQLVNNKYHCYEATIEHFEDSGIEALIFRNKVSGFEVRICRFENNGLEYYTQNGALVNMQNSMLYHAFWMEEKLCIGSVSQNIQIILRLVREWKDFNNLKIPSELLDIAICLSVSDLKEFNILQTLLKMFTLLNILTHSYNFLFYELSDHHCFIIKCIPEEEKTRMFEASHRTLTNLSSSDPNEFSIQAKSYLDVLKQELEANNKNFKQENLKMESLNQNSGFQLHENDEDDDQDFVEEGQIQVYENQYNPDEEAEKSI